MAARVLKALMRRQWRQLRSHCGDGDFIALCCAFVALLFESQGDATMDGFWCSSASGFKAELLVRFGRDALTVRERMFSFDASLLVDGRVVARMCTLLGLQLRAGAERRLQRPRSSCRLEWADVARLEPRVTRLYLVAFHDAYSIWSRSRDELTGRASMLAHLEECIEAWLEGTKISNILIFMI